MIKEIEVKTNNGLNDCSIELVQVIEKDLDKLMVTYGFHRNKTTKSCEKISFTYIQFGKVV